MTQPPEHLRLIEFRVGDERYALPMDKVEAVLRIERRPGREEGEGAGTPGQADEATRLVRVADILGVDQPEDAEQGILIRASRGTTLLAVRKVEGIREVDRRARRPAPRGVGDTAAGLIDGLIQMDGEVVILLDPEAL